MHDNGDNVLSHYDYIKQISMAWIDPVRYWPNKRRSKRKRAKMTGRRSVRLADSSDDDESMSTATSTTSTRCQPIDAATLHPISGSLNVRLNTAIQHLPVQLTTKKARCQLHRWARGRGKGVEERKVVKDFLPNLRILRKSWARINALLRPLNNRLMMLKEKL